LQQLGAENIDRIEVITNPPANFKRDGSAGIINIVTKRRAGARTATVQASVGSRGRYNLSTSQGAQIGKLNLRGTAGVRRDLRIRDIDGRRRVRDPATGTVLAERQLAAAAEDERLSTSASLGADYDLTTVDRLGAEADFSRRDADFEIVEQNLVLGTNGAVNNQFERSRISREHERNSSVLLRYHHAGENDGDGLTVTAQSSEYFEHTPPHLTNRYVVPPQAPTIQRQVFDEYELLQEFSVEYLSSLSGDGKFISGYDVERTQDHFDYSQTIPVDIGEIGPPDPDFTNQLRFEQTIHALYGSYEHPLGHWTALAGLRLEQTDLLVRQVTSAERSSQDYFRVFPTLHLSDKLDDQQTLSFSYGKRLVRPFAQDLDPNRLEPDAFTIRQGNPRLEPIEIDSLEAGWSYDEGHTSLSTTLYARRRRNDLAYLSTPISPTVVLITPANVGESTSGGVELAASGRVIPQLDFKLSGNLFYNQIDAGNLGFAGKRSTFAYQAKAAVNWRATPRDTLQINLGSTGKRLTPQGYARGSTAVDLGFRHQFRPDFSITATVSDVFAKRRFETNLATPALSETTRVRFPGRTTGSSAPSERYQVAADHHRALEMFAHGVEPHPFRDLGILGRNQVRQHQQLDAGRRRHAAHVFGGSMVRKNAAFEIGGVGHVLDQAIHRFRVDGLMHQHVGASGERDEVPGVFRVARDHDRSIRRIEAIGKRGSDRWMIDQRGRDLDAFVFENLAGGGKIVRADQRRELHPLFVGHTCRDVDRVHFEEQARHFLERRRSESIHRRAQSTRPGQQQQIAVVGVVIRMVVRDEYAADGALSARPALTSCRATPSPQSTM